MFTRSIHSSCILGEPALWVGEMVEDGQSSRLVVLVVEFLSGVEGCLGDFPAAGVPIPEGTWASQVFKAVVANLVV